MTNDKTPAAAAAAPMAQNHSNIPATVSQDHTSHPSSTIAQPLEQPPQYKTAEQAPHSHPQPMHHHPHTGSAFPPQGQHSMTGSAPAQPMMMGQGAMYQQELMALCARGDHSYDTKYGVVGIIVAVCCFPIGLLALCCDRKDVCTRCGHQTY